MKAFLQLFVQKIGENIQKTLQFPPFLIIQNPRIVEILFYASKINKKHITVQCKWLEPV